MQTYNTPSPILWINSHPPLQDKSPPSLPEGYETLSGSLTYTITLNPTPGQNYPARNTFYLWAKLETQTEQEKRMYGGYRWVRIAACESIKEAQKAAEYYHSTLKNKKEHANDNISTRNTQSNSTNFKRNTGKNQPLSTVYSCIKAHLSLYLS